MIPIARPFFGDEEAHAVREVLRSGWVTQGPKVEAFENAFAAYVGAKHACAVSSCTTGLHLALLVLGVKPGDLVVTVSHCFIATANAVRHCGAEPVFVDIDPGTYNMSPQALARFLEEECIQRDGELHYRDVPSLLSDTSALSSITPSRTGRIAAVLLAHQMGMPADLEALLETAARFGLPVVEDAACAVGSEVSFDRGANWERIGRPRGELACFSFHPRKLLTTGDGGMITTGREELDQELRILRHQGMSVSDILRDKADKVIVERYLKTGFNYRMTDLQAAVGIEQLKRMPDFLSRRRELDARYRKALAGIGWLELPKEQAFARTNWQSYPVRVLASAPLGRDELMQALLDKGIRTKPGIMNIHQEPPYQRDWFDLPESEKASKEVILLPFFHELGQPEVEQIQAALEAAGAKRPRPRA